MTNDILYVLIAFAVFFLVGYVRGKNTLIRAIISFYPSIVLFQALPDSFLTSITKIAPTLSKVISLGIVFIVLYALTFFATRHLGWGDFDGGGNVDMVNNSLYSLAALSIFLFVFYSLLPGSTFVPINGSFASLLKAPWGAFILEVVPLAILIAR